MELEFEGAAARGLRRYVRLVEHALGLGPGGHNVQLEPPVAVYLPLSQRLAGYPEDDVALVWDEWTGWSAGVERDSSADLIVLGYLGADPLPRPEAVARFVERFLSGECTGRPESGIHRDVAVDDLPLRLARYAVPPVISLR